MPNCLITISLRLKDKHAAELNRQARAVNYVWNYCNETQQKAAQSGRRWLSWRDLQKLTAGSSKALKLHAHTICRVCQQYDKSRKQHNKSWLRWRGQRSLGWVPFNQGALRVRKRGLVSFMGLTYETMHWRELPDGVLIRAGSFNRDARGHWYINMPVEFSTATYATTKRVGIDLGIKDLATLSDGTRVPMPSFYRSGEAMLGNAQRTRKTKRARSIHAKIRNRRRDYLHKVSAQIAKQFGLIVIGDVSPSKLISQTVLAKSVHDAAWSSFKHMLSYKAIRHGGRMIEVSERMTTQTCSSCGALPPERPRGIAGLGIREWTCGGCGATHDRDVNAARNILRLGQQALAEGAL